MIRIKTKNPEIDLQNLWSDYIKSESIIGSNKIPDELSIEDEYDERSFDAGSFLIVFEIGSSFVLGVGSGILANWLWKLLQNGQSKEVTIGNKVFHFNSKGEEEIAKVIFEIRSEIEKIKESKNEDE